MPLVTIELHIADTLLAGKNIVVHIDGDKINTSVESTKPAAGNGGTMFLEFFKQYISQITGAKSVRTLETYRYARSRFRAFLDNGDVSLKDVNEQLISRYEQHLRKDGLTMNTISFHLRILRTAYNKAVEAGMVSDARPFRHAYTKVEKTPKRAITIESIRSIKDYQAKEDEVRFSQDMFLFSFYTQGMSFVDMAYLKPANIKDGWLTYQRKKTGQTIRLRWAQCMQEIVDKYYQPTQPFLLPIIHSANGKERNQYRGKQMRVNRGLKVMATDIHLDRNLTMYVARHSWASIAEAMGLPINLISIGLGHSSEKTTQIYLKSLRTDQIDRTNQHIISLLSADTR